MENEKKENKNQKKVIAIVALLVLVLVVAGSYAWLRVSVGPAQNVNKIKAGTISLRLDETSTDGINLVKQIPLSYAQGIQTQSYTFSLVNEGTTDSDYTITLNDLAKYVDNNNNETDITSANKLSDNTIRIMILKNGETAAPEKTRLLSEDPGRVIDTGTIPGNYSNNNRIDYVVKVWIDSRAGDNATEANVMNKLFSAQLTIDAIQSHQ